MLFVKKKMFREFLTIFLCAILLAGAVSPAAPAVTYAEEEDAFLESPNLIAGIADTSLDSPRNHLKDDAGGEQ